MKFISIIGCSNKTVIFHLWFVVWFFVLDSGEIVRYRKKFAYRNYFFAFFPRDKPIFFHTPKFFSSYIWLFFRLFRRRRPGHQLNFPHFDQFEWIWIIYFWVIRVQRKIKRNFGDNLGIKNRSTITESFSIFTLRIF